MGVPCTSLGVVDQVVTVGSGYRFSPGRSTALGDRCPWEQVFHLAFGEAEMDKESPDLSHRADRDSHFLTAPHVSLPEEHVGYMVTAGVHDSPRTCPISPSVAQTVRLRRTCTLSHGTESTMTCCGPSGPPGARPTFIKGYRANQFTWLAASCRCPVGSRSG